MYNTIYINIYHHNGMGVEALYERDDGKELFLVDIEQNLEFLLAYV